MFDQADQKHCGKQGTPADQPPVPSKDCPPWEPGAGPVVPELEAPQPCPEVCTCPTPPAADGNCLDKLIAEQARAISEAERAKSFKADLEALLQKAKAAQLDYTTDKYTALLARWKKQDRDIAELIHRVVCAAPCWRCQIECQVCSLFNRVRDLELELKGRPDQVYDKLYSLFDKRYWLERQVERRQQVFDQVKKVLQAWEKPAADIEAVLNENQKLIDGVKELASDSAKTLYDVFIRLIPQHLAIAPPAATAVTEIDRKYTRLCQCDAGEPDDCCGPDVGEQPVRLRMLARHAYLVQPAQYFTVVCCLVNSRYLPAKEALAKAESELAATLASIKRIGEEIGARLKTIEADAKAALALPFDCSACKETGQNGYQDQQ